MTEPTPRDGERLQKVLARAGLGSRRVCEELIADELVIDDGPLAFSFRGVCGYGSTFDYAG